MTERLSPPHAPAPPHPVALSDPDDDFDAAKLDSYTAYLREIGRSALLSHDQEIALAQRIEHGIWAAAQIDDTDHPPTREQMGPLRLAIRDGADAFTGFVQSNLRLVVSIAKHYEGRSIPIRDLVQEGNIGLMKAVEKYDWRTGFRFSTYATWWIRQSIRRALHSQDRTIYLPVHANDEWTRIRRAEDLLRQTLHREPTDAQIAAYLETIADEDHRPIAVGKIGHLRNVTGYMDSMDAPANKAGMRGEWESQGDGSLKDMLADRSFDPYRVAARNAALLRLVEVLDRHLDVRERLIVKACFGIDTGHPNTLKEVGETIGMSRERVRQYRERAIKKLREVDDLAELLALLADSEDPE
jgi:RNA polymerase primary sigma factor